MNVSPPSEDESAGFSVEMIALVIVKKASMTAGDRMRSCVTESMLSLLILNGGAPRAYIARLFLVSFHKFEEIRTLGCSYLYSKQ